MNGYGTRQWSVMASFRLYSKHRLGYSVPTVNTTLYTMSKRCVDWTPVYQAQRR
jgi:hypothetical protein